MKSNLVFTKKEEVWSDSLIFSDYFEIAHNEVLKKIRNLTGRISPVKKIFVEVKYTNERNREYKKFIMNRDGFMFLIMNISTPKADDIKLAFIEAFNDMEKRLLQKQNVSWIETRETGKQTRVDETDCIKKFVEYATSQGSSSAKFYYSNITKMTYKALELINQNKITPIRDFLVGAELWTLRLAEQKVIEALEKGMNENLHYKEIYLLAKSEIEALAKVLPKSKVKLIS